MDLQNSRKYKTNANELNDIENITSVLNLCPTLIQHQITTLWIEVDMGGGRSGRKNLGRGMYKKWFSIFSKLSQE